MLRKGPFTATRVCEVAGPVNGPEYPCRVKSDCRFNAAMVALLSEPLVTVPKTGHNHCFRHIPSGEG